MAFLGLDLVLAADYGAAAFGLAGSLIGGGIAAGVTYLVAHQERAAAERRWIRETRHDVYDRFLTTAQDLQATCEIYEAGDRDAESREAVERAFREFFHVYAVLQTIAEPRVVAAARTHGYRLHELRDQALGKPGRLDRPDFALVDKLVREARHATVQAMRSELGLPTRAELTDDFNAFAGTELERAFVPRGAHAREPDDRSSGRPAARRA